MINERLYPGNIVYSEKWGRGEVVAYKKDGDTVLVKFETEGNYETFCAELGHYLRGCPDCHRDIRKTADGSGKPSEVVVNMFIAVTSFVMGWVANSSWGCL